jgi:hypothetical protein
MILDGLKDDVEVRIAEGVYQLNRTLDWKIHRRESCGLFIRPLLVRRSFSVAEANEIPI